MLLLVLYRMARWEAVLLRWLECLKGRSKSLMYREEMGGAAWLLSKMRKSYLQNVKIRDDGKFQTQYPYFGTSSCFKARAKISHKSPEL